MEMKANIFNGYRLILLQSVLDNYSKTDAKIFSVHRYLNGNLCLLKLNNQETPWKQKDQGERYPGVILDKQLT